MPRHEPHTHDVGEPAPGGKVVMKRDEHGNLVPVFPAKKVTETTEAQERPQQADDPRPASFRNIPPYGGGL
jgi:hypothetical protein